MEQLENERGLTAAGKPSSIFESWVLLGLRPRIALSSAQANQL